MLWDTLRYNTLAIALVAEHVFTVALSQEQSLSLKNLIILRKNRVDGK